MKGALSEQAKFLLNQFNHGVREQSSWDWDADLSFAERFHLPHQAEIRQALYSDTPTSLQVGLWKSTWYKPVTQLRIRALKELVDKKHLESYWVGLGPGSKTAYGISKVKKYRSRTAT
ncbi:hypothetical protein [Neptuniibacter sp. QD37_11]|uniref:hypothetical protein n=1 Tax=Neptuniibacter sp. QD37_11 TaxID=3398209 RepID=UPI0039F49FDB